MPLNRFAAVIRRMLLILAAVFTLGFAPPAPHLPDLGTPAATSAAGYAPEFSGCEVQTPSVVNGSFEQEVMELVNAERAAQGLPPLKRVAQLDDAARYHTADMVQDSYFQHDSYDRVNNQLQLACKWSDRVGIFYSGWSNLGENIAAGYSSPADVMQGWMNSSGHRSNILSQSYTEIGIGYANGNYWAQDFGKRFDASPIIINKEADTTDSPNVSLYIYGSWTEIRLRNDTGAWTGWQPFKNQMDWQLPNVAGAHIVSAEMRSGSKNSASSDTIVLNVPASVLPLLGPLPDTVHFIYSIPDGRLSPTQAVVTPANTGNQQALTWTVAIQGGPFSVSPAQGTTPSSFTIYPSGFNPAAPQTYTGSLVLTITSPAGVAGSPHRTALVLEVVNRPVREVFLPILSTYTNR